MHFTPVSYAEDTNTKHFKPSRENILAFLGACGDPNGASMLAEILDKDPAKLQLIETKTKTGDTCLIVAAEGDAIENVKVLLAHGANVHAKKRSGRTALMIGAKNGNLELVKLMIESGSKIHKRDKLGGSAYSLATTEEIKALLEPPSL